MKRTLKKSLSIILAALMLICSVPLAGLTDIDFPDFGTLFAPKAEAATSGTCGDNLTWTFNESTGELVIGGTGDMYNYAYDNRPWVSCEDDIKSVTIGNSVTSIGNHAFYDCDSLTSVTIGNNVTRIGYWALSDCESLISITIPDSVTSIDDGAFSGCGSLTKIMVDSENTVYSSDEYGVLFNKEKTLLIQHPVGNIRTNYIIPDSVTSIGNYAFSGCTSLTSITIPDNVTSIGNGAFYDCDSLTSVTIGNGVTSIGYDAFNGCQAITNIVIPESVTIICGSAFKSCSSLTSIRLTDKLTNIDAYTFMNCTKLKEIIIPKSITSIDYCAFYGCSALSRVNYTGTATEWNKIYIGSGNSALSNRIIKYNYEEHKHTIGEWETLTQSTCTTVGKKIKKCTACGAVLETEEIAMAEHIAGEWEITGNATCTENGKKVKKCVNCATVLETEEIPATGHNQGEWVISIEPTCIEQGEKIANCTECGIVVANDVVSATGHTAGEIEVTTPATCTENGKGTGSCVVCGEVLETVEIPATGHSAGVWETILEPTTETEGKKLKKCTACAEILEEATIAKLPKEPVRDNAVVNTPSTSTINFGDSIILHVDESRIPEDGRVEWTASNSNFKWTANGATCEISPEKSGDTTFTATIYDADGNPVSVDEQTMTSKAGFFQKIIAFFKGIFGLNKTIPNVFKF